MSLQSLAYLDAVREQQRSPEVDKADLIDAVRIAHWKYKVAAYAADNWLKIRDCARRNLVRIGEVARKNRKIDAA